MNIFDFRDRLITDYADYVRSFITIRDSRISERVEEELHQGLLWPDPLIQLNPSFEAGETIEELVGASVLDPRCAEIFRIGKEGNDPGRPLRLHRHQSEAIRIAAQGVDYVLTTGTGSGKSLAYIIPIVDRVLKEGSGKGIKAIIIYPMNALANSQHGELEKFLCEGFPNRKGPVTFAKYTGQEDDERRQEIMGNPPDILLTNYVMLELIMTRWTERPLINSAKGLQFLVLDELHAYRGRQGADVALLVRRVRDQLNAVKLQCVGTSATMSSEGIFRSQQETVASVASKLFGSKVKSEHVVGETLVRTTPERDVASQEFVDDLRRRLQADVAPSRPFDDFVRDPLSVWIESTFGIRREEESGRLLRAVPRSVRGEDGAASELSAVIDLPAEACVDAIEKGGYRGTKGAQRFGYCGSRNCPQGWIRFVLWTCGRSKRPRQAARRFHVEHRAGSESSSLVAVGTAAR